jgi:hypothetical protein
MRINNKKRLILASVSALLIFACAYIVTPAPDINVVPTSTTAHGWAGIVTNIGKNDAGDLHIDIAIRNETTDWSAMQATTGTPAVLTTSDGKTTNCDTVFVDTGGNRLAPGFQMRGYTGGTKAEPKTQLLYVECKGAQAAPGSKLSVDYSYVVGAYNFYVASKATNAKLELNLDEVVKDLKYPIAEQLQGLIVKPGTGIEAINKCTLTLTDVKRTDAGFEFTWGTTNPGEYPSYVHIGNPPVIGADGIIYGFYESPHLADAPITPSASGGTVGTASWTTKVTVPSDVKSLYILVSVETKQRTFVSHVIDITDK